MAEILHNSKARRDFNILETFEAGIVLHGSEVKTLRAGKAQINDAFARVEKEEVWLYNAHIDEYIQANRFGHKPTAPGNCCCTSQKSANFSAWLPSRATLLFPSHSIGRTERSKFPWAWAKARWNSTSAGHQKARQRPRIKTRHDAPFEKEIGERAFKPQPA